MEIAAAPGRIDAVPIRAWRVSVVIPAYEEGEAILPVLARIAEGVTLSHEVIVVVDERTDSTASAIRARPVDLSLIHI